MTDDYAEMGEFHDLFMAQPWEPLRPWLASAFERLTEDDLVLDLGAGTGVGTRVLADCTAAQIVAVEPSRTMRAVLLARVHDAPDLAPRVSVLAGTAPTVLDQLTQPVAGFVCAHMLGHLSPEARRDTFRGLAGVLAESGVGLVTLPAVRSEEALDRSEQAIEEETTVGRHRYVARYEPSPDPTAALSTYRVLDGDLLVREESYESPWDPPSTDQLREELDAAGLALRVPESDVGPRIGLVGRAGGRA